MSSHSTSQSSPGAFSQKKRTYVACLNCRKRCGIFQSIHRPNAMAYLARKVRCITPDEETPCKRCTEKGFDCEYVPVCVEREGAHGATPGETASQSSRSPATPTWNQPTYQPPQGQGANTGNYAHNNYGQQNAPPSNQYYGQPPYTQSSGLSYTNPAHFPYPAQPPSQSQFPNNLSATYPTSTYPSHNGYSSSGMSYVPSNVPGAQSNSYYSTNTSYPAQYG
ncbi:hypothetical protein B0H12DRAFT_1235689 [Mycena haematopus]|nr:hypothetical protein B0H12DRAFT_1235689 [Mycena haematopus]